MNLIEVKQRVIKSKLFKDSFWAVFGNGIGDGLMLLAGILIARILGKDVYGEYGMVKSTMFYIASFATFGLGFTSTKYIAQYISEQSQYIKCIVRDSITITLVFSGLIALLLVSFAHPLANFVEEPSLKIAFQALAGVVMFRAITRTQIGILSGFKQFQLIARNSVISGIFLLLICIPFSYYAGLKGSLLALFFSQLFNSIINYVSIKTIIKGVHNQVLKDFKKELINFSFPVALQESSYTLCHWTGIMLLTRYSSVGELGLYTAAAQWNAIITMVPGLLSNVFLSYLSSTVNDYSNHKKTVMRMLSINFVCTLLPFGAVYILAGFIASFYGPSFVDLPNVLRVLTFATIFDVCANVFKSEFMALGKTWTLFAVRCFRDVMLVVGVFVVLNIRGAEGGALSYGFVMVSVSVFFLIACVTIYRILIRKNNSK